MDRVEFRLRVVAQYRIRLAEEGIDGRHRPASDELSELADDLGMSKAGVVGQFGTKEALQLAVVDEAVERFRQRVPGRAVGALSCGGARVGPASR